MKLYLHFRKIGGTIEFYMLSSCVYHPHWALRTEITRKIIVQKCSSLGMFFLPYLSLHGFSHIIQLYSAHTKSNVKGRSLVNKRLSEFNCFYSHSFRWMLYTHSLSNVKNMDFFTLPSYLCDIFAKYWLWLLYLGYFLEKMSTDFFDAEIATIFRTICFE